MDSVKTTLALHNVRGNLAQSLKRQQTREALSVHHRQGGGQGFQKKK